MGLYSSVADVTQSLAGMGIQSSGVRQIAEAVGSGEEERIARTATVLGASRCSFGLLGALLLILFANPISRLHSGPIDMPPGVALLSFAVLFREVSVGQGALIQGMRRIPDLARMNALCRLFGTVISIPVIYFFARRGSAVARRRGRDSILTSWWYSRKIQHSSAVDDGSRKWSAEASGLLKLGFAFMASGFLTMGAAYAIRIIVLRIRRLRGRGFVSGGLGAGRPVCRIRAPGDGG